MNSVLTSCLQAVFSDDLYIHSTTEGYDAARQTRNLQWSLATYPLAITYATETVDVVEAINCAAASKVPVCARGGRHGWAAYCDGGVVIDLSRMTVVEVDAATESAVIGAGTSHGAAYTQLNTHNLTFPGATSHTVGVVGCILGGCKGKLDRLHGLGADHLQGVTVVTAR
jgi:FAD/FMN-containing dehydrogenase